MNHLVSWANTLATTWGGPGLFVVAFLDSSVLSLPEIIDLLVFGFVMQHKDRMLYYAFMSTLGSLAGCFIVYGLGRSGGEAWLRRRRESGSAERSKATFQRYGLLAILVPAILPPPAPFKIFVLLAGITRVRVGSFAMAVIIGRGVRYLAIGLLAVWYGEAAKQYLLENGKVVALVVALVVLAGGFLYIYWTRRTGAGDHPDHTTASDSSTSSAR